MAISNLTTGLRPGVCTSLSRPTAPYVGQHIYETDTLLEFVWNGATWVRVYTAATTTKGDIDTYSTAPTRLPVGANNQLLVANSATATGLEWQNNTSGLVLVKSQAIGTNVTSIPVTNAFSADYDNYKIIVAGTYVSAGGNSVFMQLTGSTGATYYNNGFYMNPSSPTLNGFNQNGLASGIWLGVTGFRTSIVLDITNPFIAVTKNVIGQENGEGGASYNSIFFGSDVSAVSRTGFTLIQAVTNWTGGIIYVYGYRKA